MPHVRERVANPRQPEIDTLVAPGTQTPSPKHDPNDQSQALLHVSFRVPHLPHITVRVSPGVQIESPVHAPEQLPQKPQVPDELHVRFLVVPEGQPALVDSVLPGVHSAQGP